MLPHSLSRLLSSCLYVRPNPGGPFSAFRSGNRAASTKASPRLQPPKGCVVAFWSSRPREFLAIPL
jgi:hypothetical protein